MVSQVEREIQEGNRSFGKLFFKNKDLRRGHHYTASARNVSRGRFGSIFLRSNQN